ncbi:putative transcriptional accessory protein [Halobacteriovorax marinus SJ]|uniref:Transcriptional accessory protein n=1 Tax=Halobacteriovorax marinus (strain ATCC BAA-682 / DSM 15412 / SJ) TaxID=862908 RepID=E1X1X7_HALMS|nr:Tex family protein [Halobacteriovorax marinus]CBW26637.1 putative transcriptional accessory protein [Halobacteriovorax marinus SJ]
MAIDSQAVVYASTNTEITAKQVIAVLTMLIDEECTIPFITRYRKEATGGLDEVQIRDIQSSYEEYLEREKRRQFILDTIKKQEQLTPELEKKILAAQTLNQLEDIYAPYKVKKKTKGMIATEAGLAPFADLILSTKGSMQDLAKEAVKFINPDKKVQNFDDAVKGACDIIIEKFAHDTEIKEQLRADYWKEAILKSTKRDKAEAVKDFEKYKDYFEFEQRVSELKDPKASHRFLAMRRGMTQKVLKVEVSFPEEVATGLIKKKYFDDEALTLVNVLMDCSKKAFNNYIHGSLDLEMKTDLKKLSDESAINVFGVNLKNLLLQPYLGAKAVLGMDPGVRTGVKLAVVDNTGKFLVDTVVYPHPPKNHVVESAKIIEAIIDQFGIEYIAIGNGTYGRETLAIVEKHVEQVKEGKVKATMISEAGASIYSASEIARKEFPDKDPTVRGAISIARRFQDPLAELVKIDPKSIGVGQYQHDVNQTRLKKSLDGVVESCVNFVGVDINTASAPLLSFISGIGPSVAKNVVKYREENQGFSNREELLKVSRFSNKVFQQAAGFLRVYGGENPLDSTFIHPESYEAIKNWCDGNGLAVNDLIQNNEQILKMEKDSSFRDQVGEYTHNDIIKSLRAPSQDPRTEFKTTEFRKDISKIGDLKVDEWYPGIVTNITQFGAFVDIGIKENGLLHVSQIADKFVENALDELKVGQELKVRVKDVDLDRGRISLSCKQDDGNAEFKSNYESTPRRGAKPKSAPKSDAPLKNNAFAGLKNFKFK